MSIPGIKNNINMSNRRNFLKYTGIAAGAFLTGSTFQLVARNRPGKHPDHLLAVK